jgi:hypothetical protein
MARRGRKRQLDAETLYWQLVQSGTGTVEACRIVGIGRKTGYRWRAENGGLPPSRVAESARSGRYLSLLERQRIATLHRDSLGIRVLLPLATSDHPSLLLPSGPSMARLRLAARSRQGSAFSADPSGRRRRP